MKKSTVFFLTLLAVFLMALFINIPPAQSEPGFWTSQSCNLCHADDATSCDACHAHGVHSSGRKDDINLTASTDKTVYAPDETLMVTVDGGYRGGWIRAVLYDEAGVEVARSSGPGGTGSGESFPIVLTATAPASPGTYAFSASWYGNQYDLSGVFGANWVPDPTNPNHGEEIVSTNTFTVDGGTVPPSAPDITVTDSVTPGNDLQIPFGSVTLGTASDQTVTVTNDGTADLALGTVSTPLTPFSITGDTCSGAVLAPSEICTLTVRFAPTVEGASTGSFNIPSDDPDENPVTVSLSGSGIGVTVPDITVTDSVAPVADFQVPFGDVLEGNNTQQTVTVTNNGNGPLVIGSVGLTNPLNAPFGIVTDTCSGLTIAPAGTCSLTISFSPTVTGTFTDSFDIPSDDPDENPVTVSLSGSGISVAVPDISVTDSVAPGGDLQVPFGNVTELNLKEQTVTITNVGSDILAIGLIANANRLVDPFSIVTDNCSSLTMSPNESCTFTVRFSPSAEGSFTDSFDIPSNDPDEASLTVNVEGMGLSTIINNPPDIPRLVFPANGQVDLGTSVEIRWKESTDPDGDAVSYLLFISDNPDFTGAQPVELASVVRTGVTYAGTGMGLVFFGIALSGGLRGRRIRTVLIVLALIAAAMLTACGGGDDGGSSTPVATPAPPPVAPTSELTHTISGLDPGTTYYWKIVAIDASGDTATSDVWSFTTD